MKIAKEESFNKNENHNIGFFLFISSIYSQNIDFSLNAVDEQNLYDHSRNIANSSTLWLAGNINTPESSARRYISNIANHHF